MAWTQVIWFVVTTLVSIALAPKPKPPRAAALEDFDFPTAEEGRPIPVVFGTIEISGPNVLWYGELQVKAIRKRSGFSKQTVGYKYFIAFHIGLCHGPVNEISMIRWGEKTVWTGLVGTNSTIIVDQQGIWGGEKRGGGINGRFDIMMGAPTQTANAYLTAVQGGLQPGYRGILGAVWRGGYIGTSESVRPIAWTVHRTTAGWNTDVWYPSTCIITTDGSYRHMNPAHICYQILTDPEWGMGVPPSMINEDAWEDAADLFAAETFGLDLLWNQQTTIEEFLKIVLDHCAAAISLRTSTGQFDLVPIRGDYDPEDLLTLDPSNIKEMVDYQRQGWGETVNEVTLVYTDPATGKDTAISAHDLGNQEAQGRRIPATVELPGIRIHDVAKQVVQRELAARVTPLGKGQIKVNRHGWRLPYNAVFNLTWPALGIVNVTHRVVSINRGTLPNGEIIIDFVEDIYSHELANYLVTEPQDPDEDPPGPPPDEEDTGIGVISSTQTEPPTGAVDGDGYYVPPGATGEWAGHDGQYADWDEETGTWVFTDAEDGALVYDEETQLTYQRVDGVLVPFGNASITVSSGSMSIEQVREIRFEGDVSVIENTDGTAFVEITSSGGGEAAALIYADGSVPGANTIANTSTETAFSSQYTIPFSDLTAAAVFRFQAFGVYNTAAAAGTLRLRVKLGATTLLDTAAFTATNSLVNRGWELSGTLIITNAGSAGQVEAQGLAFFATGAASGLPIFLPNTAKVAADLSAPRALTVTAQWGTANSSNSINMRTFTLHRESTAGSASTAVSLLHFEGIDGATSVADTGRIQWVLQGNAQIDTAQFRYGSSSLLLDGTGDFAESMSDEAFVFGTSDFTIECWVRFSALSGNHFVFTFNGGWGVYAGAGQWGVYNNTADIITGGASAINTWYHVALVRLGSTLTLYINGSAVGSTTNSTDMTSSKIRLGAQPAGTGYMAGWIDEFRVHRSALYSTAFSVPTAPFEDPLTPATPEVALLHLDGTDGSTSFVDVMGRIYTPAGNAQIDTAQSVFGGASLLLDGNGDWIETPATSFAGFLFGTGSFTVECWMRTSVRGDTLLDYYDNGAVSGWQLFTDPATGRMQFWHQGVARVTGTTDVCNGAWHHIAVTRWAGTLRLFVDGALQASAAFTNDLNNQTAIFGIGAKVVNRGGSNAFDWNGWIDEVRVCKGYCRYTEAFLVPTGPIP